MEPFHAVVKNGRLTLDEPSPLPDGHVVVLIALADLLALDGEDGADGVEDGPVAFSFASPRRGWKKPKPVDANAILEELRSM